MHPSLEIIFGPMFSGKTTEMMRRIRRLQRARKKTVIVKFNEDDRCGKDLVSSHDGLTHDAIPLTRLKGFNVEPYDAIGIDEGQFFPDLKDVVLQWIDQGKIVVISSLDSDSEKEPFGQTMDLARHADKFKKLTAICYQCDSDAPFTMRTTAYEGQFQIGGSDKFQAACRKCHKPSKPTVV